MNNQFRSGFNQQFDGGSVDHHNRFPSQQIVRRISVQYVGNGQAKAQTFSTNSFRGDSSAISKIPSRKAMYIRKADETAENTIENEIEITDADPSELNELKTQRIYETQVFPSRTARAESSRIPNIKAAFSPCSQLDRHKISCKTDNLKLNSYKRENLNSTIESTEKQVNTNAKTSSDFQAEDYKPSKSERECKKIIHHKSVEGIDLAIAYCDLLWYYLKFKNRDRQEISKMIDKILKLCEEWAVKNKPDPLIAICRNIGSIVSCNTWLIDDNRSNFLGRILELLNNIKSSNLEEQRAEALIEIGLIEFENFKKPLKYLINGLKIQQKMVGDSDKTFIQNLVKTEKAIANQKVDFHRESQHEEAEIFFRECLEIHQNNKRPEHAFITLINLGKLHKDMKEPKKALEVYETAKGIYQTAPKEKIDAKYNLDVLLQLENLKKQNTYDYIVKLSKRNLQVGQHNFNEKMTPRLDKSA